MSARIRVAMPVVFLAAVAACSPSVAGTPSTAPTTANMYGAPHVAHPLNATPFLSNPCTTLKPDQLKALNLAAPGRPQTTGTVAEDAGPACTWTSTVGGHGLGVGFLTGNKHGLADLYRGNSEGAWPGYWQPTTVNSYPAVFNDVSDGRTEGYCVITTGISDALAFTVNAQGKDDPCPWAVQAASEVIGTLQRGGK